MGRRFLPWLGTPIGRSMRTAISVLLILAFHWVPTAATAQQSSPSTDGAEATETEEAPGWWNTDVWRNPGRGFNWYPPDRRPPAKKAPTKPEEKVPGPAPKPKDVREIRDLEELQKEMRRLREVAIFDPTNQNVHRYLQAQEYVLSRSQLFADTARRVVWQNPDVDYTAKSPQANYSLTAQRARATDRRYEVLEQISKNHGILFFVRSDCAYCHDMAPVLSAMSRQYGIEVLAVSLDGKGIPGFPRPRTDNGISKFVSNGEGVATVPALYLVSNDQKTVVALGTGALAAEEIAERIRVLMTTQAGNDY
jgi:conjugal transfer pilus assembly protein TraF